MKQLNLTPPLLLITMGYPGAGKTFFARQFAETYGMPHLNQERLRFELFEKPQFNEDESDIINRVLFYALEQTMKTNQNIICDGNFSTAAQRKALYEIAKQNVYRTLLVWLQTDRTTSYQRAARRDRRSPESKYSFNLDQRTFEAITSALQRPTEKEASIVVSGKHAFKGQNVTVLRKIAELYTNEALGGLSRTPTNPAQNRSSQRMIQ